jgi:hypothetical protein
MHLGIFEERSIPGHQPDIPLDRFDTALRCSFSDSQLLGIVSSGWLLGMKSLATNSGK